MVGTQRTLEEREGCLTIFPCLVDHAHPSPHPGTAIERIEDSAEATLQDTDGLWESLLVKFEVDGAASALCSFDLSLLAGSTFDAFLDELSFHEVLFSDGFESGGLSAWTSAVP